MTTNGDGKPARWELYGGRDPRDVPSVRHMGSGAVPPLPIRTVQNGYLGSGRTAGDRSPDRGSERHMSRSGTWPKCTCSCAPPLPSDPAKKLRRVIQYLEETFDSPHPLLTEKMVTDGVSVFVEQTGH